jgi:hypothetical protein
MNKETAVRMGSREYVRPYMYTLSTEQVGSGVTLPTSIREVPGSNIDHPY